jgi:hypothetical protein
MTMDPVVVWLSIRPEEYLKVQLSASWQTALAVSRIASRKVGTQNTRHLPRSTRDVARVGRHAFALGVLCRFEFRPA